MSRPGSREAPKLSGTTEECFYDLVETYPHLPMLRFIAEFCGVELQVVQSWQIRSFFPGGMQLLKLRCLLYAVGYEVTELMQLNGDVRQLGFLVALSLQDPEALKAKDTFNHRSKGLNSVWRILLWGGGLDGKKPDKVKDLVKKQRSSLDTLLDQQRRAFSAVLDEIAPDAAASQETVAAMPADPLLITAFMRAVSLTIGLGHIVLNGDAVDDVRAASHNGLDLVELSELLRKLTGQDN